MLTSPCGGRRRSPSSLAQDGDQPVRQDSAASTASSAGQFACKSEITRARIDASLVARLARLLDAATHARAQKNSYRQLPR